MVIYIVYRSRAGADNPMSLSSKYVHWHEKVQVGKDQEKAQPEKDSHSKNQGGKNQTNNQALIP